MLSHVAFGKLFCGGGHNVVRECQLSQAQMLTIARGSLLKSPALAAIRQLFRVW